MGRVAFVLTRVSAGTASGPPVVAPALRAGFVAAAALAALVAVVASPHAALVAKAFADPFFHSTSAGAAIALLAYAALAAAVLAASPAAPGARVQRVAALTLLLAVLAGNAANLAGHVAHVTSLGLPATLAAYHWNGDANTYSYLLHSHEGKTALHALVGPLAGVFAPALDVGQGLAASETGALGTSVAGAVAIACGGALACAVGASLVLLRAFAAPGADRGVAALYVFCALNAIKTIVDGGPLTYRFAPVFVALCAVLAARTFAPGTWRAAGAFAVATLGAACLGAWAWFGRTESRDAAIGLVTTLAVIAALVPRAWIGGRGRLARAGRAVSRAGAVAAIAALAASLLGSALGPNLPLDADARATTCDAASLRCTERPVGGLTLAQVYLAAGEDPTKPRRTFVWRPGEIAPTRLALAVVASEPPGGPNGAASVPSRGLGGAAGVPSRGLGGAAGVPPHGPAIATDPIELRRAGALPSGSGEIVVAASGTLPAIFGAAPTPFSANNYHVFLHAVAARLRAGGVERFTLVPIRNAGDARALGLPVSGEP